MSVIPLADFKAHLDITGTAHDAELTAMLDAAESWVSRYIGSPLGVASRTVVAHADGAVVFLPRLGLTGVSSVTAADGTALTGYTVSAAAGVLRLERWVDGDVTVTATFSPVVPADVRLAVLVIAAHLWETQRGASPSPLGLQDGSGFQSEIASGLGYAIPNRARALLEPYLLPTVA